MKVSISTLAIAGVACLVSRTHGFTAPALARRQAMGVRMTMTTMAESGVPPVTSESSDVADVEIPTNLPSECGMDYIPLATMLATGQLAEADQVCYEQWTCFPAHPSNVL